MLLCLLPVYRPTLSNHAFVKYKEYLVNNQPLHESLITENTVENSQTNVTKQKCEVIHVGIVCSGQKSVLFFHVMLKSIYFYRNNPINFHIVVNKATENVLKTLFETWNVPQGILYIVTAECV